MKRIFVVLAVIGMGVGLFWWGQRSRTASSVMSTSEDTKASLEETVSSQEPVQKSEVPVAEKSSEQTPQRSAATTGVDEHMKSREINPDMAVRAVGPTGNPNPERLLKTHLVMDTKWKVWSGVKAIPSNSLRGDKSEVLAVMGGYSVVADELMNGDDRSFSTAKYLVLYDERMSRPGIVTGELKISLQEGIDPEVFANEYGLNISSAMKNIRLFFMRSKDDTYDLGGLVSTLKKDPRVSKVELSIVSRNYEKF